LSEFQEKETEGEEHTIHMSKDGIIELSSYLIISTIVVVYSELCSKSYSAVGKTYAVISKLPLASSHT